MNLSQCINKFLRDPKTTEESLRHLNSKVIEKLRKSSEEEFELLKGVKGEKEAAKMAGMKALREYLDPIEKDMKALGLKSEKSQAPEKKPSKVKMSNPEVLAMAKAHGVGGGKFWSDPDNVQKVADAVQAKDASRLPSRPRLVAEDLIAGKTPEQAVKDLAGTPEQRAEEAKKVKELREDEAHQKKTEIEDKAAKEKLAKAKDISTRKDESELDFQSSTPTEGGSPAQVQSFHVEKVKRDLGATKQGQWVLNRVEIYQTLEQAQKALGAKIPEGSEGGYHPTSGRSVVILDNVRKNKGELPSEALRRVMVHEAVGHGGMHNIIKLFPELEKQMIPWLNKARDSKWSYRDKDGNTKSLLDEYIHLRPDDSATFEENAKREDLLFQEWFSRSIESTPLETLMQGKAVGPIQKIWDAFLRAVNRLLGRPYASREGQQFAYDLAKKIMGNIDRFPEPTVEKGGEVLSSSQVPEKEDKRIPAGGPFYFRTPLLEKTPKGYSLAGKPISNLGDIQVAGLKGIAQLKDGEIELYKRIVPEAFSGDKVNVPKLMEGLQKNGPQVEVHTYGQEGSFDSARVKLDEMTHVWRDNLPSEQESIVRMIASGDDFPSEDTIRSYVERRAAGLPKETREKMIEYANLYWKAQTEKMEGGRPRATSYYNSISPFDTKKHPVIRVDVTIPNDTQAIRDDKARYLKELGETPYGAQQAIKAPQKKTLWQQDDLHENLPNTLGWAMAQVVPDPKTGEPVLFVGELQSRWAQEKRGIESSKSKAIASLVDKGEVSYSPGRHEWEFKDHIGNGEGVKQLVFARSKEEAIEQVKKILDNAHHGIVQDHPLLDAHQNLVLKAVIAEAQKRGIKKIAISESKAALMTEMLDNENYFKGPFSSKELAQVEADKLGKEWKVFDHSFIDAESGKKTERWYASDKQGGFDVNYDTKLPSAMSSLTGAKGEMQDFGVHKNGRKSWTGYRAQTRRIAEIEMKAMSERTPEANYEIRETEDELTPFEIHNKEFGSPVFKDSDGRGKSNVTARTYDLENLDQHKATQLFADPFGFQLVKSSLATFAREAGNLARFTAKIAKQFGDWIKPHAEALWKAVARGGQAVGDYLKGMVEAAKKTSEVGGGGGVGGGVKARSQAPETSGNEKPEWAPIPPEPTTLGKAGKGLDKAYDYYIKPLLHAAEEIHPEVGNVFRRLGREENMAAHDAQARTDAAYTGLRKVKAGTPDAQELWVSVDTKEGRQRAVELMKKHGATEAEIEGFNSLFGPEGSLQHFFKERRDAGLTLGEWGEKGLGEDYFPRRAREDRKTEFQQWLFDSGLKSDVDPVVSEMKRQKKESGASYSPAQEIAMQAAALRQVLATRGKGGSYKGRRIHELDQRFASFYEHPAEALHRYASEQARSVPLARTFGANAFNVYTKKMEADAPKDGTLFGVNTPLGKVVQDLKDKGELSVEQIKKLHDMTQGLIGHMPTSGFVKLMKDLNMPLVLANPLSAIKQVPSEFALSAGRYGVLNTLHTAAKGLLKGWNRAGMIDVQKDLGLSPSYEVAYRNDPIGRVATKLAKLSGFQKADLSMANVLVNASMNHLKGMKPEARLRALEKWKSVLEGPDKDVALQQVSKDIGEGNFLTENAKNVGFYNLTGDRPTGLSSMPLGFLKSQGLGQIPYFLRGWGMFNFDRHRRNIWDGMKSGDPSTKAAAVAQGVYLLSLMVAAGAAGDDVVDWLMGKPVDFGDRVKDNLWKTILASSYTSDKLFGNKPDLKGTLGSFMNTPTIDALNALHKNAVIAAQDDKKGFLELLGQDKAALRMIPLGAGTLYHAKMGGSREDAANAVDRELPDSVQRLTKEHSSLSEMGASKRRLSQASESRYQALSSFSKIKTFYVKKAKEASKMGDFTERDALLQELERLASRPALWKTRAASIPQEKKEA